MKSVQPIRCNARSVSVVPVIDMAIHMVIHMVIGMGRFLTR